MSTSIVFFDIAGHDTATQAAFYTAVFGWEVSRDGQLQIPVASPLHGSLRADPPHVGIYLGVADVTATLEKVAAHGGTVVAQRFGIPGVVILGLFTDPAGNRLGLVELDGDKPRIP